MEILTIEERKVVTIKTVEEKGKQGFDIGKIKVSMLPCVAKKELFRELREKKFNSFEIHMAMQSELKDLEPYVNVWKYVAYLLAVELLQYS